MLDNINKKVWLIIGVAACLLTTLFLILVIALPNSKEDSALEDTKTKSSITTENNNLWASFPGELKTQTTHKFDIFDYSEASPKIGDSITLEEEIKYENIEFKDDKAYFDAKSTYKINQKGQSTNPITTYSLGLFETLETLANPPLYQKSINSILYLMQKVFQSPEVFFDHLFAKNLFNEVQKDQQKIKDSIFKDVDPEKVNKIFSTEEFQEYSFMNNKGVYQWTKGINHLDTCKWLESVFFLTKEEIDSIFSKDREGSLYKLSTSFHDKIKSAIQCQEPENCDMAMIYEQLINGNTGKVSDETVDDIKKLYELYDPALFPFNASPELYRYFDIYKTESGKPEITYDTYKLTREQLTKLLDTSSQSSLFSSKNMAQILISFQSNNVEKIANLYGITADQVNFLCNYIFKYLPNLLVYNEYNNNAQKVTPIAKAYTAITQKSVEETYFELNKLGNIFMNLTMEEIWNKFLSKFGGEFEPDELCPLIMQHALDDGRKVLKICSDPKTSFNSLPTLEKWIEAYLCLQKEDQTQCNMTLIKYLESIVYITEDEIKAIYDKELLGGVIDGVFDEYKKAYECPDICDDDYLKKMQFWKNLVTEKMPGGKKYDSICQMFPDIIDHPVEISYYAKKMEYQEEIPESDIDIIISLTPKIKGNILLEENYKAFNAKMKLEQELSLMKDLNAEHKSITFLNNALFFKNGIKSNYLSIDSLLQGTYEEDKTYIDYLSQGNYYDNFKPGIKSTTGFNFGINLNTGEKKEKEIKFDRYGIVTTLDDKKELRKIININDNTLLNIQKEDYDYTTNTYTNIDTLVFNNPLLTGDKAYIDGFQYDQSVNEIYYYDKISSRPFKFTFAEEKEIEEDITCRKYVLDKSDLSYGINEESDLDSKKALFSQKMNKPFVVNVDDALGENYICVEVNTNMVLQSEIHFVYGLYTKNYGKIYPNIENDKIYQLFNYAKNYKVDIPSFNEVFPFIEDAKSFKSTFIPIGVVFLVIFFAIAIFAFYRWYKKKDINVHDTKFEETDKEKLINSSTKEEKEKEKVEDNNDKEEDP